MRRCRAQPICWFVGYYQKRVLIVTYFWPTTNPRRWLYSSNLKFDLDMEAAAASPLLVTEALCSFFRNWLRLLKKLVGQPFMRKELISIHHYFCQHPSNFFIYRNVNWVKIWLSMKQKTRILAHCVNYATNTVVFQVKLGHYFCLSVKT